MICKECGHLLNEGNRFCPNCGAKVAAVGPTSNVGTSKSKLDDLMSNLDQTADRQNVSDSWTTEAPKNKRDFHFDKINWNLDGYPSEGKKKTEEIDFNWEAVVEPSNPEVEEIASEKPSETERGGTSYLGEVNEEFRNPARDDMETFRAMEKDELGFEECVADKLETPEDKPIVPEFMEGQNYAVVGEESEKLISRKEMRPEDPVRGDGSYLGEVNEEFRNPAKDDRNAFRAMEKDEPGFEECVAGKLETPEDKPIVPEFLEGQNYDVVNESTEPAESLEKEALEIAAPNLFSGSEETSAPEESGSKLDKFYTPNKKNAEFQAILDKEYNRLTENNEASDSENGSYLGDVNEEFKDLSEDDRNTFRAMEKETPDADENIAYEISTPKDALKIPEFMEGQNYDVVGEASEKTLQNGNEIPENNVDTNPERDVEEYIENLNSEEVSLVELLKAAARDEAEKTPAPSSVISEAQEEVQATQTTDDFMRDKGYNAFSSEPQMTEEIKSDSPFIDATPAEDVEFVGVAQPQEQAPIFAAAPEDIPAFTNVASEGDDLGKDNREDLIFADNLAPQSKGNEFDYEKAFSGFTAEKEANKNENSQIIEDMIKDDAGGDTAHPDDRITFQDVFKEEIMSEKETTKDAKPKKHILLKVLFIILMILILLEVVVIGIKYLAPTSGAATAIQDIFNAVFGKLVG